MKKTRYYPTRIAAQANWLTNYALKPPIHGPTLGLAAAEVTAAVNGAKWGHYILSEWLSALRTFTPATTDAMDAALIGAGEGALVLPTFAAPPLPAGVAATPAGLLTRIFALNVRIKATGTYPEAMGADLGIVGHEDSTVKPAPKCTATVEQGNGCQCVRLTFSQVRPHGCLHRVAARRGVGIPSDRHRKPARRPATSALPDAAGDPGIPDAFLGQRHAQWRLDGRGESNGVALKRRKS